MLHIRIPIIVEGKYDKARLAQVVSAPIITTEGFGIFNNAEKTALIRRVAAHGVILLCDSDGGGKVIRSFLKGIIAPELVYDLYVPQVAGKERRKRHGSKAGFLGVEGIDNTTLASLFDRLADRHPEILAGQRRADRSETDPVEKPTFPHGGKSTLPHNGKSAVSPAGGQFSTGSPDSAPITKTDLYLAGLTGGENAAAKRDRLCVHLGFPAGMNAGALLTALNILYGKQEFEALCETVLAAEDGTDGE